MWGVKRGIYSNEAGQGTGPHAAAAAEVSHPAKQGLVQAFAVYVDTLFVCSATGFLILTSGAYRVFEGESADGRVLGEGGALGGEIVVGPAYAQEGFDTLLDGAGSSFIAISLLFFCLTTIIAYYYMAETNLRFLMGDAATRSIPFIRSTVGGTLTMLLQAVILVAVVWGTVSTAADAWTLGDIGVGVMAWLNIVGILLLQQPALKALRDYESQKKRGLDPQFDPAAIGVVGAHFWEQRRATADAKKDPRPSDRSRSGDDVHHSTGHVDHLARLTVEQRGDLLVRQRGTDDSGLVGLRCDGDPAAHLALHLHRDLDGVLHQKRLVGDGEGSVRQRLVVTQADHSSSARCGATGATIETNGDTASRGAPSGYCFVRWFVYSMSLAIAVLNRRAA